MKNKNTGLNNRNTHIKNKIIPARNNPIKANGRIDRLSKNLNINNLS
jgi:hypothetical protein